MLEIQGEMKYLEFRFRGMIEEFIDQELKNETLSNTWEYLKLFQPIVKSRQDVLFGYIIGSIITRWTDHFIMVYHREATGEERNEILDLINRRASDIKSRILETSR